MYQLNSSGKYFAFKEQLKYAVVKIVREKYLKTVKFQDSDELKVIIEFIEHLLNCKHVDICMIKPKVSVMTWLLCSLQFLFLF